MPLKRPVTLPQARRWPAAARRRESFCARMGGMRELLTGERAARDPASPINRALAAWDCDEPELLRREHVSKGIRMKITKGKVGSEVRKENPPIGVKWLPKKGKPKITYAILPKTSAGRGIMLGEFSTKARAEEYMRSLTSPWNYRIKKIEEYEYEEPPEENPARKNPAKKMTARYQILRWIQGTGIKAVSKNRTVSLSKDEWMEVFDNWEQALDFLVKARDDRQIYGKPWPWETKKNPARKTPAPASKTKTYAVVQIGRRVPIAVFATRADAVQFGQSWADIHKSPVQVIAA